MTITCTINGETVNVYNTVDFAERLDEELDTGGLQILNNREEPYLDYTLVQLVLSDGETAKTFDFYAFDNVEQRRGDYYVHTLQLVELSRLLMGVMIDGRAVTQPIEGSGENKKNLRFVTDRLLQTAQLRKGSISTNGVTSVFDCKFSLDSNADALLEKFISPEFQWGSGTLLWECLCDIGNVINCMPRLKINSGSMAVTFDKINDVTGVYEV